jgi:hypothetical protein
MSNLLMRLPDAIFEAIHLSEFHPDLEGLTVWVRVNLSAGKRQEYADNLAEYRQVMAALDDDTQDKEALGKQLAELQARTLAWWAGIFHDDEDGKPGKAWTEEDVRGVFEGFQEKGMPALWGWLTGQALNRLADHVRGAKKG